MLPTLVRRQFTGLIPPKIATPSHLVCILPRISFPTNFLFQSAGSGEGLAPLVNFYSKLPKGRAPAAGFDPEKKALNRLGLTILFFFGVGYTIDYNSMFQRLVLSELFLIKHRLHLVHLSKQPLMLIRGYPHTLAEYHKNHPH